MSEILASQAREITDKHEYFSNEIWYSNFKDDLFESIKNAALKGSNQTKMSNDLLKCTVSQRQYLISKLVELDYSVKYESNVLTISW